MTWIALTLWLAGCGGTSLADHDAAADASEDAAIAPVIAEPAPPEAPRMTPCPTGWREAVDERGPVTICEPPESEPCDAGQAAFSGECEPIGDACGGDLPAIDGARFVLASAAEGGDGSAAHPFRRIADALEGAVPGTRVAVGRGEYDETLVVPAGVAIEGACAALTVIRASTPAVGLGDVAIALEDGAALRNMRVASRVRAALEIRGRAELYGVGIDEALHAGILVTRGASLEADRVVVRSVTSPNPAAGQALIVLSAAATLRRSILEDTSASVAISTGELIFEDSRIAGSSRTAECIRGQAGHVTLRRSLVERCGGAGVTAIGEGTSLIMESSMVRGCGLGGVALSERATATIGASTLDGNTLHGVEVFGSTLEAHDLVVRDTRDTEGEIVGIAFVESAGQIDRVALLHNASSSLYLHGGATHVVARDLMAHDARESENPTGAIQVQQGASLDVERVSALRNAVAGIYVTVDADAHITDARVEDTTSSAIDGVGGYGIVSAMNSTVEVERGILARNRDVNAGATDSATLRLFDVAILDSMARECALDDCATLPGGHAVIAVSNASVRAERFVIDHASLCGAFVEGSAGIDLHSGLIAHAEVGVCMQAIGYDVSRLMDGVRFDANTVNLDATMLPVPALVLGEP